MIAMWNTGHDLGFVTRVIVEKNIMVDKYDHGCER